MSESPASGIPVWALVLLIVPALFGFAGMVATVRGMSRPKPQRQRLYAIGAALTVVGGALFLVILGLI